MKNGLKTTTLMLGLLAGGWQPADAQSPKIVVGIVVDQLRTDYLEQLRPYFGDKGFNRLISEGVYIPDVDFKRSVSDAAAGASVVYTGSWPSVNGVSAIEKSPENLRVSTIADEFFINNGTLTKIYSVSGDASTGAITAGHAGNCAIWFDENTGKWSSAQYYNAMPPAVANKNRISPLASKILSSVWRPVSSLANLPNSANWKNLDFSYTFSGGNRDAFSRFKSSGLFNAEITDAAIDLVKTLHSGNTGMLNIEYSLAPYSYDFDGDNRPELADSYIRLDNEIGRLLDTLDKEYGSGNSIVFVSSTGYAKEPEIPETEAKIPTGEITLNQVESLLNSFLSATYGNGDYVELIKDNKLFLDSKNITDKGLDLKIFRREAKDFLLRMGGVSEIFTIDEVLNSESPRARELALAADPKNAPDLYIFFQPGWTVTYDNSYPHKSEKIRLGSAPVPAFILAPGLEAQKVEGTVEATALAPTIASAINIRAPNAAASKPLLLTKNKKQ